MRSLPASAVPMALWMLAVVHPAGAAAGGCLTGAATISDAADVAAVRQRVELACPCVTYDGTAPSRNHAAYVKCAKGVINDASDGTPLAGGVALRPDCVGTVIKAHARSACGFLASRAKRPCCQSGPAAGKTRGSMKQVAKCVSKGGTLRAACPAHRFLFDACSGDATNGCTVPCGFGPCAPVRQQTVTAPASATTAHTPDGVITVTNPKLVAQFDTAAPSLNNVTYTRFFTTLYGGTVPAQPDAILVLVPGFEGGAGSFKMLAENLISRALRNGQVIEVWGFDRRTHQLEDRAGLDVAEGLLDGRVALDWLYGGELALPLSPSLTRRAVFYDTQADVPFVAEWTGLVFSRDIDDVVTAARAVARNQNVILGGHSEGTGFTARYAATDFDPGPGVDAGYTHVKGLVLIEGGGGSTGGPAPSADTLDRMIAKADGGLYGAVAANAARCVDGTTPCTIATEAADCGSLTPPVCTPPTTAYSVFAGLLNPRILAAIEPAGIQGMTDPDSGQVVIQVDQGAPGNNAVALVPDLSILATIVPPATVEGAVGSFLDDDGPVAAFAFFLATSLGAPGSTIDGLLKWQDVREGPFAPDIVPDNGAPPVALPGGVWGQEKEPTRFDRVMTTTFAGGTNFTDWYYPSAGLGTTSVGTCSGGTCTTGNTGASCAFDAQCTQAINLDSTPLSNGRNRPDIENLTQAAAIDIPVIAFGGSNGLVPVPGQMLPFASSIGTCAAPSCTGSTARVVDAAAPSPAFPTFGGVNGGFEVYISEGFSHVDIVLAEDDADNHLIGPLADFIKRNAP